MATSRTSSETARRLPLFSARRRAPAVFFLALLGALGATAAVVSLGGPDGTWHPVSALVDPDPAASVTALRVLLLTASALTAGAGLARVLLGSGTSVPAGASHRVPAVKSVGYSMPSASLCHAGSTIVR